MPDIALTAAEAPVVLLLSGSCNPGSRSLALLAGAEAVFRDAGWCPVSWSPLDFPARDLLCADFRSAAVQDFLRDIGRARAIVLVTPVRQAAYGGALKLMLDLLPKHALRHAQVLPMAVGGSKAHLLIVDYALRPVLAALKAERVLNCVFATERDIATGPDGGFLLAADVQARLEAGVHALLAIAPPALAGAAASRLAEAV